ncbi:MAG: 3-oxoacyl-ACP reductase FabG [Desulfovibrio sp.]|jgi:3-oxoacyl-[acyl-carrier protein] reductase|nr:3-oxoacyl-ACP reductase FabG [Desulfovibrio sp.]
MQKIALVTGASRGIGKAIALGLAADGFDIWLNCRRDGDDARTTRDAVQALGRSCRTLLFDVSDADAVDTALDGPLAEDVPFALINNAGFARDGVLGLMSRKQWDEVLDVHLGGFFNVTRKVLPYMQRKRRGRIVNVASVSGEMGVAGQTNYCAAKAGLIGATKALAREVGKRGILVNAVAPGFIDTGMTDGLKQDDVIPLIPLARTGTPEEVAHCVRFLCSEGASYITGHVLAVNGGLHM